MTVTGHTVCNYGGHNTVCRGAAFSDGPVFQFVDCLIAFIYLFIFCQTSSSASDAGPSLMVVPLETPHGSRVLLEHKTLENFGESQHLSFHFRVFFGLRDSL